MINLVKNKIKKIVKGYKMFWQFFLKTIPTFWMFFVLLMLCIILQNIKDKCTRNTEKNFNWNCFFFQGSKKMWKLLKDYEFMEQCLSFRQCHLSNIYWYLVTEWRIPITRGRYKQSMGQRYRLKYFSSNLVSCVIRFDNNTTRQDRKCTD